MCLTTWACNTSSFSFWQSPLLAKAATEALSLPVHLEWESSPVIFNQNPSYWKIIKYVVILSLGSYGEKLFLACFKTSSTYWKSVFKPFLLLNLLFFLLNKCNSLNLSCQIMFVKHLVSLKVSLSVLCNFSAFLKEKCLNRIEYSSWVSSLPRKWKTYLPCLLHDTLQNIFQIDVY